MHDIEVEARKHGKVTVFVADIHCQGWYNVTLVPNGSKSEIDLSVKKPEDITVELARVTASAT